MKDLRLYKVDEVRRILKMPKRTFDRALANGSLPFLVELLPRTRPRRFLAEPFERYVAGLWGTPRLVFGRKRG